MKALVTGATGFIGAAVARRLVAEGWDVRGLVRPTSDRRKLAGARVEVVEGDVLAPATLGPALEGVDAVFHCAAVVELVAARRAEVLRTNIEGTRNVLDACLAARVGRVVYLSSVAALGLQQDTNADETVPHSGRYYSAYDRSKHASELLAREYLAKGLDIVFVLPSVVIGPGDPKTGEAFQAFLRRKIPGVLTREGRAGYVHIDDLTDGILRAHRLGRRGERYIFNQVNWAHSELFARMARVSGIPPPTRRIPVWLARVGAALLAAFAWITRTRPRLDPAGVRLALRRVSFTSRKAREELGWVPADFEARFEATVRYWMEREVANRAP